MYEYGRGVPQDCGQAVEWYRKAAEQAPIGEPQYSLGRMYMQGYGVPRDYVQAHLWFNLAASQFLPGKYQEAAAQARDLVAARMTPAQVAEAQRLAREWKPKRPSPARAWRTPLQVIRAISAGASPTLNAMGLIRIA